MPTSARREARRVLQIESDAIRSLAEGLDERFDRAVGLMLETKGRVVVTGIGKSGIVAQKVAATLASTGTAAFFLHPSEALHGDLGMILPGDVVLALSHSGETEEVVALLPHVRRRGASLVALTRPGSTLARNADVTVPTAISEEACPLNLAPTASTTAQLAMGDALAMALSVDKGFRPEDFAALHPGGKLGKRFLRVSDLMHAGDAVPLVPLSAPIREVVLEMSKKRFGITGVVDAEGRLAGCVSDGDLRRLLEREGERAWGDRAADAMNASPKTIPAGAYATEALRGMEERKITSFFVVDADGRPTGILHLHDLWGVESI
ncbi:KpsF/GutQ family sugar-phosphate isomerase [Acidobacteria bacterium ACD]|nr:MAG: KpsF/GutQ family sugar-phosphate isomerase [Acidobacteriota bacterium]MCE7957082.1 KpsF/GutQ family sugar-phosphate isomerase [Acidobacteria bacterium ACB2]MDL1949369.1 KpsF/GutQ family sugar-phosphate isomerase [Acidobacteria bacterium ACD]